LNARAQQPLSGVIATLVELDDGEPLYRLGGVILAKAARTDIVDLEDVRGKRVGTPGQSNLGGFRPRPMNCCLRESGCPRMCVASMR